MGDFRFDDWATPRKREWFEEIRVMAAPEMFNLDGRVAVVTGGNGGIGRGIALGLAAAGAAVAVLARNEDKNAAVLGELRAVSSASIALKLDVTDRAALAP